MITGYDIALAPYLPLWALACLAGASILVLGLMMVRGVPGTLLRACLAGLLLLALANPALLEEQRDPNRDVALLVVDETPSQTRVGRLQQTRAAATEIETALQRFSGSMDIRKIVLKHDSVQDGADGTRAVEAMREALADVPARRYAGAILITDGQIHDAEALSGLPPGPLHALIAGEADTPDRRLVIVDAPSFGVVDEPIELVIRVEDPLANPGDTVRPTLKVDGEAKRVGRIPANEDVKLRVTLEHRGASVIELSIPELPGELATINNRAVLSLNGVRDRLRVLLVSGEPHPGERTWRNLLKSDPSVDLVHFTILRPPEKQDGTPIDELSLIAFPTRELFEVKLNDFDLVVFDSYRRRGVLPTLYLGNIVEYVRNGGALLDAAGAGYAGPFSLFRTPLIDILPLEPIGDVSEGRFVPQVTDTGLRHPVTSGLPGGPDRIPGAEGPDWGAWLRQIDVAHIEGETLMTGLGSQPLLTLNRVDEGRVAQMSSDHIWLWARGYDGGGPHAELLRRLAHWLMKEPELEEEGLKAIAGTDRLEIQLRTLEDRAVPPDASIRLPDGSEQIVPLSPVRNGLFAGELSLTQSGLYEISEGDNRVLTAAGVLNAPEFSDLVATDSRLAGPVAESGGRLRWISQDGLPELRRVQQGRPTGGSGWIGLTANGDFTVTGLDASPLIPGWILIVAAIGLLSAAWYREAR